MKNNVRRRTIGCYKIYLECVIADACLAFFLYISDVINREKIAKERMCEEIVCEWFDSRMALRWWCVIEKQVNFFVWCLGREEM